MLTGLTMRFFPKILLCCRIRPRPQASFFWRGHEHSDFLSLEPPRLSDRVREARARQPFLR